MRRSFLFAIIFGFCGGIILAEFVLPQQIYVVTGFVLAIGLSFHRHTRILSCIVLCVLAGWLRWDGWVNGNAAEWNRLVGQTVVVTGSVIDEPVEQYGRQEFELTNLVIERTEIPGKVSAKLPVYPVMHLGSRIEMECVLTAFQDPQQIRNRMHGIWASCQNPKVFKRTHDQNSVRLMLGRAKAWTINRITNQFPEPQSSLLIGILLGRQVPMPPDINAAFQATGTTHMIALSGFNVTIMVTALSAILIRVIGKRWAWIPGAAVVIIFVVMTGASASVTRAGVMSCLALLAGRLGRPISMVRVLSYTLLVMVWHNPLVLIHDLGFQLSFLATIGLVAIAPDIQARLAWVPEQFSIRENLGTTLGAMLATEPLIIWQFGRVSTVAPFVNVLVLPLIPIAMAAGSLSIVLPIVSPLADAILRLVLGIIQFGAHLPFASQNISGVFMMILAGGMAALAVWSMYAKKIPHHSV